MSVEMSSMEAILRKMVNEKRLCGSERAGWCLGIRHWSHGWWKNEGDSISISIDIFKEIIILLSFFFE